MQLVTIPIDQIVPRDGDRLRALRPERVQVLAESITEIGLNTPISVTAHEDYHETRGQLYSLVTGEHRLEACRSLGWTEIPAVLFTQSSLKEAIWHIDENLCRSDLNRMERDDHISRRKDLYEGLHPETKWGGDRGNQHTGGKARQDPESGSCQKAFIDDTANKTGISRTVVAESAHRAKAIAEEVKDEIRDMPAIADKVAELNALASLPKEEQKKAVEMVKSGEAKTARQAAAVIKPKPKQKPKPALPAPAAPVPPVTPAGDPVPISPEPARPSAPAEAASPEPEAPEPVPEPKPADAAAPPRPDIAKRVARVWDLAGEILQSEVTSGELREYTKDLSMCALLQKAGKLLSEATTGA